MENPINNRVVPIVTATSTLTELTFKLLYSCQEIDREEVEKLLSNREKHLTDQLEKMKADRDTIEKRLKSEVHRLRRDRDMLELQRDSIEKSLKIELRNSKEYYEIMIKSERDSMEKKLSLALFEKCKLENEFESNRRVLEDKIEMLERENGELKNKVELAEKEVVKLLGGNKRVRNGEFRWRNVDLEICLDKHEVIGSEESSKSSAQAESECSVERAIGVKEGELRRSKEARWKTAADMFSSFRNDPELCMSAVCALYRQHISAGKSPDDIQFRSFDIASGTEAAKYLINNDLENKLSRSLLEVQQDRPSTLQTCWRLVIKYLKQLFDMYQKKLDPFFCPES